MIWLALLGLFILTYGWASYLAVRSAVQTQPALILTIMIILSTGTISLIMFWLGLLNVPITPVYIIPSYLIIILPGWLITPISLRLDSQSFDLLIQWRRPAFILASIVSTAIVFNALYWPFYRDDTLGIYHPFAKEIAQTHDLIPITPSRSLYELYPQLASMTYALVYMISGWHNTYPAGLITTLLSLACLLSVWLLANEISHGTSAWIALFLLLLTPDFSNWASSGYVDLPMAFFYSQGIVFAWVLWRHNRSIDAILVGLCIGLATWTKNAALLGAVLTLIFLSWGGITQHIKWHNIAIAATVMAWVGLPWYVRNWITTGTLIPDTLWSDQAQQTTSEILVLVTHSRNYGVPGIIMGLGVLWSIWHVIRTCTAPLMFLLWFSVPYYLFWLQYASYDPRFILLILPLLAILGSMCLSHLWRRIQRPNSITRLMVVCVLILITLQTAWHSIDYKRALLANPFMTHAEKLEIVRSK